jgi:hypothetical protein
MTTKKPEKETECCPTCGRCPTCGHSPRDEKPPQIIPMPYPVPAPEPYRPYQPFPWTITYGPNTCGQMSIQTGGLLVSAN